MVLTPQLKDPGCAEEPAATGATSISMGKLTGMAMSVWQQTLEHAGEAPRCRNVNTVPCSQNTMHSINHNIIGYQPQI